MLAPLREGGDGRDGGGSRPADNGPCRCDILLECVATPPYRPAATLKHPCPNCRLVLPGDRSQPGDRSGGRGWREGTASSWHPTPLGGRGNPRLLRGLPSRCGGGVCGTAAPSRDGAGACVSRPGVVVARGCTATGVEEGLSKQRRTSRQMSSRGAQGPQRSGHPRLWATTPTLNICVCPHSPPRPFAPSSFHRKPTFLAAWPHPRG